MTMSYSNQVYSCSCPPEYTLVGVSSIGPQSCLLTTAASSFLLVQSKAVVVQYNGALLTKSISSQTMLHYFTAAAAACTSNNGPDGVAGCQTLANLCVLQLFDITSQACAAHLAIVAARGAGGYENGVINWVYQNPWLFFALPPAAGAAQPVCLSDAYRAYLYLATYKFLFTVAVYTMNGTFAGFQTVDTLFSYCGRSPPYTGLGGGSSSSTIYQILGYSAHSNFSCELNSLVGKQQLFYELYLYDRKTDKSVPVPVRIVNLQSGGVPVNSKYPKFLCDSSDIMVRRFFLADTISGIASTSSSSSSLQAIRYATYMNLEIALSKTIAGHIYPPVLTIYYNETIPPSTVPDEFEIVDITFNVDYTMNMDNFKATLITFFIIVMVFTGLLFFLRMYYWNMRNTRLSTNFTAGVDAGIVNAKSAFEFALLAMHTWVMAFFPFTVAVAWYFFLFFKIETSISILMPPQYHIYRSSSPYFLFTTNLHVMAFFQFAYVCVMVARQCNADLFFIDWEPARSRPDSAVKGGQTPQHVSVWRSILVANEWAEMQTLRKTNIKFTLFMLGFLMVAQDLQYNGTFYPVLSDKSPGEFNVLLRFANTTFFWLVLAYGQYVLKYLGYEQFVVEPPEQLFIDFCTIAKISVIVLDEKYHGYYLHCRSPHQYAEGTMSELVEMLHKEEAGLTSDRSLEGAPPDVQSFQIFLSGECRAAFDKVYVTLAGAEASATSVNESRARAAKARAGPGNKGSSLTGGVWLGQINFVPTDKVVRAWKELTVFLQEFIENNFGKPGLRRVIREPTYYEKLFYAGPNLTIPEQPSVFFTDRDLYYTTVMFLGREMDLLLLNILSYSLFDLWLNSTITSVLLCYLLDYSIAFVRRSWGQATISRKTLIDRRFLI